MRYVVFLILSVFCIESSVGQLEEGFESVINLDPPASSGVILETGWLGLLRSSPDGFTGVFQGVPPDMMGGGGGFTAHEGPENSYMGVSFTSAGSFTINDVISTWMITPPIQLSNNAVFSFYTRTAPESLFPDRLDVLMSTNGTNVDIGNSAFAIGDFQVELLSINPNLMLGGYPDEWTKIDITIEGLSEPTTGRIALHYFVPDLSINGNAVGIDTLSYDGGIKCVPGDVNMDGEINLLDVSPFVALVAQSEFSCEGDINADGIVDLLDVGPFVDLITAQ